MNKILLDISLKTFLALFTMVLVIIVTLPEAVRAGNGTFKDGKYEFCVSVRFNATDAQIQQIRTAFQNATQIFADATEGQQRFGNIHIINNSGASLTADYWVNPGTGRAYATQGKYGVRGEHVNLFFGSNFQATNGADGDAYTIAHEHAHHVFGVVDEYSGPSGGAECAAPPDTPTQNFCLMDNYFTRGGRSGGGTTYTLNEFCVSGNHDPDGDTHQQNIYGKSCWETIAAHPSRSATAPSGLPTDTAPVVPAPSFDIGGGGLRIMLLLDRSGSMDTEQRLVFAKQGAGLFTDFVRTGDDLGVASFSDAATVNFPLTNVTGVGTRSAAKSAINSLSANGSTNIGGGLLAALGQITSQSARSCNEVIVLLSDGDHNVGTPPSSVISALQSERVTVLTVGVGSGISSSGEATLQNIANQTGGKYYRVSGAFSLVGLFLRLAMESIGNGLLIQSPEAIGTNQTKEIPVSVESEAANATFAVTLANPSDVISLSLRTPSGTVITPADAGTNPNVQFISSANSRAFQITAPEAGSWTIIVTAGAVTTGMLEVFAFAEHDGMQLNVSVTDDTVTSPEAVEIQATPTFKGQNVTCSSTPITLFGDKPVMPKFRELTCPNISGTVTRPNGPPVPITLFDDGQPLHSDYIAGDGVYSANFNSYQGEGTYTFDLTASVSNGVTYAGESLFSFDPSNEIQVPPFIRRSSTTAVVSGATAIPSITAVNPGQGNRGQTLNVAITGANTNFTGGNSLVSFSGAGVTVNSTTVNSITSLTVNITIASNAALSARDITVTTGSETVTASAAFHIVNSPPVCSNARPSVALITPPNRSFVPVTVLGVSDPDNDPLTIAITTIRQDEPVDHIGDGSFAPDSVINGSTALVRAESILGTVVVGGTTYTGNGRFYHINFTATDAMSNSCAGTIKVAVPHTRTSTPIDGGPLFNSVTAQPARFSDFDGDRKSDLSVFREGAWYISNTSDEQVRLFNFGLPNDKIVPADYDGDGKTDIAVYRDGAWWRLNSDNTATVRQFGIASDIPVPADYDGDGKDDLAVFRQGAWYLLQSSAGFAVIPFGLPTDKPVPADYDGDGKTDIAVYRDGTWYLLRSAQGFSVVQFGLSIDKPTPSDYDGDGKADIAVFRNGTWYLLRSSEGVAILQFGLAADIPTPADYNGDGKAEIGVFRDGDWYSLNISNGQYKIVRFGLKADKPIPSAFVP